MSKIPESILERLNPECETGDRINFLGEARGVISPSRRFKTQVLSLSEEEYDALHPDAIGTLNGATAVVCQMGRSQCGWRAFQEFWATFNFYPIVP